MDIQEMHIDFDLELDKTSNLESPAFEPEEKDAWLNKAIRKFVKTRYSGINIKRESFEQTQKRIDDLRTLIRDEELDCIVGGSKKNSYIADLDDLFDEYWFTVGEEVLIGFLSLSDTAEIVISGNLKQNSVYFVVNDDIIYDTDTIVVGSYFIATAETDYTGDGDVIEMTSSLQGVTEITSDTYRSHIDNPYSYHILHYEEAKPLRLFIDNLVELITDGSYGVLKYYIRYLKAPAVVDSVSEEGVDCDLPEHTHDEIVKLAVSMALENIEQPRYQSHLNEVASME